MSSRRQRSIPLGGRYRQVSLYHGPAAGLCSHTLLDNTRFLRPYYCDNGRNIRSYLITGRLVQVICVVLSLGCLMRPIMARPQNCHRWNCPCAGSNKRDTRLKRNIPMASSAQEAREETQALLRTYVSDCDVETVSILLALYVGIRRL